MSTHQLTTNSALKDLNSKVPKGKVGYSDKERSQLKTMQHRLKQCQKRFQSLKNNTATPRAQLMSCQKELKNLERNYGLLRARVRVDALKKALSNLSQTFELEAFKSLCGTLWEELVVIYSGSLYPSSKEGQALLEPFLLNQLDKLLAAKGAKQNELKNHLDLDVKLTLALKDETAVAPLEKMELIKFSRQLTSHVEDLFQLKVNASSPEMKASSPAPFDMVDFDKPSAKTQTPIQDPVQATELLGNPLYECLQEGYQVISEAAEGKYRDKKLLQQALDCFLKAIDLEQENYRGYFGLGYLYSVLNQRQRALYFLELALELSDDNVHVQAFLETTRAYLKEKVS